MKKVYLFSNIYPLYRKSIWDKLLKSKAFSTTFFFSTKPIANIACVPIDKVYTQAEQKAFQPLKNIFLSQWLLWQIGVLQRTFDKVSAAIFLGEMTVLSTWIAVLVFKLRGAKVIFWGHGLYGDESSFKRNLRLRFLKLADHNLVYENRAKELLINNGLEANTVSVVYNSINYEEQKELFNKHEAAPPKGVFKNSYPTLLFVGRLTPQKKVNQLLQAAMALNKVNYKCNVLLVGDGPSKKSLQVEAQPLILQGQCIFYGTTYNEEELSRLIYTSQLVVSPGNIGLTAIHALSYGTPVCSHSNFNHQMPEVEAIIEGENGFLFDEDDVLSLTKGIKAWFKKHPTLERKKVRTIIDKSYNPNFQLSVIETVLQ